MTATWKPKRRRAIAIAWARRKSASAGRRDDVGSSAAKTLQDLLARSDNLYRRIARLDDVLFGGGKRLKGPAVQAHLDRLQEAFGSDG